MASKAINIIASCAGQENVTFKLKSNTPLNKLMDKYAETVLNKKSSQVDFMYEDKRIGKNDTAEKLGMRDGDVINISEAQVGGTC